MAGNPEAPAFKFAAAADGGVETDSGELLELHPAKLTLAKMQLTMHTDRLLAERCFMGKSGF